MKFVRDHDLEIRKANLIESFRTGAKSSFRKTLNKMIPKEKQEFVNVDKQQEEEVSEAIYAQYKEVLNNQNSLRCELPLQKISQVITSYI